MVMYKGDTMQRTQIYFEQDTLQELKTIAKSLNISVSEFIRRTIRQELRKKKERNLNDFITRMKPLESFGEVDATEYVRSLRDRSRILDEKSTA